MKDKIILCLFLVAGFFLYGQVGIHTPTPAATLDVTAKKAIGSSSDPEGFLIPRVDRQRAQSMTGVETSTLVYVNDVSTGTQLGTAVNIDTVGYYYYNSTEWIKLSPNVNLYNSDGILTEDRMVIQEDKRLAFTGATSTNAFSIDEYTFSVDAMNHRVGIGTISPDVKFHVEAPEIRFTNGISKWAFAPEIRSLTQTSQLSIIDRTNSIRRLILQENGNTYLGGVMDGGGNNAVVSVVNGNVGIKTTAPQKTLHVNGSFQVTNELNVGGDATTAGNAGTIGQILASNGPGAPPGWLDIEDAPGNINIYNSDGTLAGNRIVTQDANTLAFTGSAVNAFSIDGTTFSVDAKNNRVGIGTTAPNSNLDLGTNIGNSLTDVAGKKLALYNSGGTDFYGLGINSGVLQFHAASTVAETPGMVLTSGGNVGIGTDVVPNSNAILELAATNKGFLPPRLTTAQRNAISNPPAGLMIYNVNTNCMDFWNSSIWVSTCALIGPPPGIITTLNCAAANNIGILENGNAASGVSSAIPYTGGNGGSHGGQIVTSTGVTGLTATLDAGNFATGNGTVTYTITGTPSAVGTASFAINIGGQSCTLTRTVIAAPGAVLTLNCAGATNIGTLAQGAAASGVSSIIPYTGGNGGAHNGQTVTSTGVTGLTATLSAGSFANGNGNLTYIITGTPSSVGNANFVINIGGQSCTLTRPVVTGSVGSINCGAATNNGTLTQGIAASGVNSVIPYTGGNGGSHSGQTVTSTGVTGLTATLSAGNFANGNATLTYTITGTPNISGTATFAISIGGQACTLTRTVNAPPGISLNCAGATNTGNLVQGAEAYQVSSQISYTGGTGSSHSGQVVASTGVTGLTATLSPGSFANGSGTLTYTITGTPSAVGTANFAINIGGAVCTLSRTVIAPTTSYNCTVEGTFPDPLDPRKYWRCIRIGGVLYSYHYTCPNGSHFDPVTKLCTND